MNADRIASAYRWIEYAAFGRALERARFDFLSSARDARRVLILGEGDGRFLSQLLTVNRHATVEVIETSARMIHLSHERLPSAALSRVEFHQMDAVAGDLPQGPFDLAVSHFFLDVFDCRDASAVILKVSASLTPGAYWLVSDFEEPPKGFPRLHARVWLFAMYSFFSAATDLCVSKLPPYRVLLACAGLTEVKFRERRLGLIRSQLWRKHI